ncbi:MAG: molybdopterin molybdotransferase MoeA [Maribacter sp.]|nr:molybdopterin molybdotransferase MoeA [Maribacter sp.]
MNTTFITYEAALAILEAHKSVFANEVRPLEDCTGAWLAEDLIADRDFPPFDRVTMDGIAIVFAEYEAGRRTFPIESLAPAGTSQLSLQDSGHCIEVMTGAIMPEKTDTVIRYEDLVITDNSATITVDSLRFRQNVHFKGIDILKGNRIVRQGGAISSAEINIAAAVGKSTLLVKKMPKVVIISTGDELINVDAIPKLHQIRRSNIYGIKNTLKEWGLKADLAHLPDDPAEMKRIIPQLLDSYEVLIFTGGVSKGKFDFLPEVLEWAGVMKLFHKIQQRPGKPFWFGTNGSHKKIFALPGNPVSSFVCLYVYFQFWLKKSLGVEEQPMYVILDKDVSFQPDLIYFLEANLESRADGSLYANPIEGNGSGDFANLVKTDGFLVLPQYKSKFKKGEVYRFVPYRSKF